MRGSWVGSGICFFLVMGAILWGPMGWSKTPPEIPTQCLSQVFDLPGLNGWKIRLNDGSEAAWDDVLKVYWGLWMVYTTEFPHLYDESSASTFEYPSAKHAKPRARRKAFEELLKKLSSPNHRIYPREIRTFLSKAGLLENDTIPSDVQRILVSSLRWPSETQEFPNHLRSPTPDPSARSILAGMTDPYGL